jgi:hypothetical protein
VLDADIRDCFGSFSHTWMITFLQHRIGDRRILRLIKKWLKAGVLEDGEWSETEKGTPQGSAISPLLVNVYLHYVFDLWLQHWRKRWAAGEVIAVRYADDSVLGFQHRVDAERFLQEWGERLQKFGLELHPDKTRLIEFGRFAAHDRKQRGESKPETFNFLGFTHICGQTWKRQVLRAAPNHSGATSRQAETGEGRSSSGHASAAGGGREMVEERGARLLQLSRRTRQSSQSPALSDRGTQTLVASDSPSQSEEWDDVGAAGALCGPVASRPQGSPSLSPFAL